MLAFENYLVLVSQMYFRSTIVLCDFMNDYENIKEIKEIGINNKKEVGRPGRKSKK